MGTVTEVLRVVIEGVSNIGGTLNNVKTGFSNVNRELGNFNKAANMSQSRLQSLDKWGRTFTTTGGRLGHRLRMMTSGLRGFRMELLGVLFFGMSMAGMFNNMLRPAGETLGIFELWGVMLNMLFLPIMVLLLPYILKFINLFINLPEPVKLVIGAFTILGSIIGTIMFVVATLALGLGSLFQTSALSILIGVFKTFWVVLKGIGGFVKLVFTGLSAGIVATIALIALTITGLWLSFQENFNNIREWAMVTWEGIKNVVLGVLRILHGAFKLAWSILTLDLQGIKDSFSLIWTGIKQIVWGAIQFMIGLMVTLGTGVLRGLKLIKDKFAEIFGEIVNDSVQWGIDIINGIIKGMKSMGSSIKNWFTGLFSSKSNNNDDSGSSSWSNVTQDPNTGKWTTVNDFIMQPGGRLIKTDPNDTIVGTKGGSGKGTTINQYNTISGTLMSDIDRAIKEANSRLVDDIRRMSGA